MAWIRRFIVFHGKRHPADMDAAEVSRSLTWLAVDRRVAASTHNQALGALLFLYRAVLGVDLPWLDDVVRFRWKDYADGNRVKVMALAAEEFIRRFLLHVAPERFVRARHFGLLANRTRTAKLDRCRELLDHRPQPRLMTPESVQGLMLRLTGLDIERCPVCGQGRLCRVELLEATGHSPDPHDRAGYILMRTSYESTWSPASLRTLHVRSLTSQCAALAKRSSLASDPSTPGSLPPPISAGSIRISATDPLSTTALKR